MVYSPNSMPCHNTCLRLPVAQMLEASSVVELANSIRVPARYLDTSTPNSLSSALLGLSPPFPLGPLLVIASGKLGIVVALFFGRNVQMRPGVGLGLLDLVRGDEVAGVEGRVLVFLYQLLQAGVSGVDQLIWCEFRLVLDARARPGLEHHLY